MDLAQVLDAIQYDDGVFLGEEARWILDHYEEAKPGLIQSLEEALEDPDPDFSGFIYAMYILAQMHDRDAFAPLLRYLYEDEETLEMLLGDILTDDLPGILAAIMAPDDLPALLAAAKNAKGYLFARHAAVSAMTICYVEGKIDKRQLIDQYRIMLAVPSPSDDECEFLAMLVSELAHVEAHELYEEAISFYDRNEDRFDSFLLQRDEIEALLTPRGDDAVLEELREDRHNRYVGSVFQDMGRWYHSQLTASAASRDKGKIGRNDPCPCGSGKKYKKCCLPNDEATQHRS